MPNMSKIYITTYYSQNINKNFLELLLLITSYYSQKKLLEFLVVWLMPCLLPLVSSVLLQPPFLTQWQLKSILCFLCWFYILKQGQKPFFLKGHAINISDFVDNVISVPVAQLCFRSMHAAIGMTRQMSVAMIQANETKQNAESLILDYGL